MENNATLMQTLLEHRKQTDIQLVHGIEDNTKQNRHDTIHRCVCGGVCRRVYGRVGGPVHGRVCRYADEACVVVVVVIVVVV